MISNITARMVNMRAVFSNATVQQPNSIKIGEWEDVVFFDFIRPLYGCVLAVLFSGIAVGTHQSGYGG